MDKIDTSKYLHKWWIRTSTHISRYSRSQSPKQEIYYFFYIKSKEARDYSTQDETKTLYGFLAFKITFDKETRYSFTNPGKSYMKWDASSFGRLQKTYESNALRECIAFLFSSGFNKWSKKYSGWRNIL